jgi:hypothetical protein
MSTLDDKKALRALFTLTESFGGPVLHRRFTSPEQCISWCNAQPLIYEAWAANKTRHQAPAWEGLAGQDFLDLIKTGRGTNATASFNKAQAKLKTNKLAIGGAPVPALTGGAWVIPAYLSGNPLCARTRPRAKLPHRDFRFSLQCSAWVDQAELGSIGATIARAIWDYTLAGGTCSLTMFYTYGFGIKAPENGAEAVCFEVNIPISGITSIALALSTAFYRPVLMNAVSYAISPKNADSIPMKRHLQPRDVVALEGTWSTDRAPLAAVGIEA